MVLVMVAGNHLILRRRAARSFLRAFAYSSRRSPAPRTNFDAATRAYFDSRPPPLPNDGLALDLGTGRGRLSEYFDVEPARIIQADIALRMLTLPMRESARARVLADALALPFMPNIFAVVAAFLFDPFNVNVLFEELARVMKHGATFIGTMPHYDWGRILRSTSQVDEAVFVLKTGDRVGLPSFLSTSAELAEKLTAVGLKIVRNDAVTLPRDVTNISPDIEKPARTNGTSVYEFPILQVVVATKV